MNYHNEHGDSDERDFNEHAGLCHTVGRRSADGTALLLIRFPAAAVRPTGKHRILSGGQPALQTPPIGPLPIDEAPQSIHNSRCVPAQHWGWIVPAVRCLKGRKIHGSHVVRSARGEEMSAL